MESVPLFSAFIIKSFCVPCEIFPTSDEIRILALSSVRPHPNVAQRGTISIELVYLFILVFMKFCNKKEKCIDVVSFDLSGICFYRC